MSTMSRERMLAAIRHEELDHVPFWSLWWPEGPLFTFSSAFERVEKVVDMGLDDTLRLEVPHRIPSNVRHDLLSRLDHAERGRRLAGLEGVTADVWRDEQPDGSPAHIIKQYYTPSGPLRQVVRESEAWVAGLDIPLMGGFADVNVSSGVECIVKGPEDLDRLAHLLQPPSAAQLADFREYGQAAQTFARRKGILVEGGWVEWGDALLWLLGVEGLVFAQVDDPGFVERLLEMLWSYEQERIEILLDIGVDVVVHRGWYHVTDFWSPRAYRRFLKPLLQREIELVHSAGAQFSYIMTKGIAHHYDDILDLGVDILWGVDPVEGGADLAEVKERIGREVCLLGGLNSFVTLGLGSEREIRKAVRDAVRALGPGGGYILAPVDQISPDIPAPSIKVAIDEWRRIRDYSAL